jgi:hypothetical protein
MACASAGFPFGLGENELEWGIPNNSITSKSPKEIMLVKILFPSIVA